MINAGFNPLQQISEKTGKSIAQLKKEMSAGAISAQMVQQAFIDATSEGGKFFNMSQNAAGTINGQISMLQDALDTMFNELGTSAEGFILNAIKGATSLVENYETIGRIIISLISTYGVYRAALVANIALTRSWALAARTDAAAKAVQIAMTKAQTVAQLALNAAMKANPYVIAATAVVGLGTAIWALADKTTAAERAQKSLNEAQQGYEKKYEDLRSKVLNEIDIIQDSISTMGQKQEAYIALSKLVPSLTEKWSLEELAIVGLTEAEKALNEERKNITKAGYEEDIAASQAKIAALEKSFGGRRNLGSYKRKQEIEEEKAKLAELEKAYKELLDSLNEEEDGPEVANKKFWEKKKAEATARLEALDVSKKGSKEWNKYVKEIEDAQKEIDKYSTTKTAKDTKEDNQDKAKRAENLKRIQEYKDEVVDAKKQAEFEIRQAEINAMKDSNDKTLAQINLDYDKKIEANKKREKDFIKSIAEQKALEWEVANPDKVKKGEKFDKSTVTAADLTPQQRQILEFYELIARKEKETAEANTYKEVLDKYQTYMQKRKEVYKKYEDDLAAMKDEQGNYREGFSAENEAILKKEQEEALAEVDIAFAMKEEQFAAWANKVSQLSLKNLEDLLTEAELAVEEAEAKAQKGEISKEELGKYKAALAVVKKAKKDLKLTPEQKAEQDWKDLYKTLGDISGQFQQIGKEVGGTAGEIISLAGTVSTGIMSMIDGVKAISKTAVVELRAVEKASVILGIISTAIRLLQTISEFTGNRAFKEYERYAEKVKEINDLTDAVNQYKVAVLEAAMAENNWFSTDNLKQLRDYKQLQEEIFNSYMAKLTEAQAVYQNQSGGGWLTNPINWIMGNIMGGLSLLEEWRDIWGQGGYDKGTTAAINNLRIETRKASKGFLGTGIGGKSQKTEDLVEWVRKQGLGELFNEEGMINKELAESILETYGDKLVGQTKETLETLIQLKEQYDEYVQQLREYVSNLYEPLVDNFVDSLWAWFDEGKDALDSFKDYASDTFRDIVSDMMKTIVLEKVVGTFSDDIADLYEQYSKGKIDEATLMKMIADRTGNLVDTYEEQVPVLQNIMNLLYSTLEEAGISLKQDQQTEQKSTYGGFETMSEQTGTELNGRFTALQLAGEEVKRESINQTLALNEIKGNLEAYMNQMGVGVKTSIDNILTFVSQSYMELQQINENTANNVKELKSVSSYIKKWDTKIMGL